MPEDRATPMPDESPEQAGSGAVDAAAAKGVRDAPDPKLDHKLRDQRRTIAVSLAASAMIGAGVIMLVSWNWGNLTPAGKAALSFLPWLLSTGLLAWVMFKVKSTYRNAWLEGSATLQAMCLGASLAFIALIYPSGGSLTSLLLLWAVFLLLQTYLTFSVGALIVYALVCINYCFRSLDTGAGSGYYWLLMLAILPLLWNIFSRETTKSTVGLMWVMALSVTLAFILVWIHASGIMPRAAYLTLFASMVCISRLVRPLEKGTAIPDLQTQPFDVIGQAGIIIAAALSLTELFWHNLMINFADSNVFEHGAILLVLAAVLFSTVAPLWRRGEYVPVVYALFPVWVWVISGLMWWNGDSSEPLLAGIHPAAWSLNLYLTIISVLLIRNGLREFKLSRLNYGVLLIAGQILHRVIADDYPLYAGAIIFIVTGVLLLWFNLRLFKTRDQEQ